jgi:UDP-3-O-[3-hydroxymyristoyl] glucosamine N-acyltransferase
MNARLCELATLVEGRLGGEGDLLLSGAAPLGFAKPGEITLCEHPRFLPQLAASAASAVVVPPALQSEHPHTIAVARPQAAFARIVAHFRPQRKPRKVGIHPLAIISPSARLAPNVEVHAGATLGDEVVLGEGCIIHAGARLMDGCRLGKNVTVFPSAVLYENTLVGNRVLIHAGAVLGAYGFGYATIDGRHELSAQLGYVQIEDDVEIGAGTTIDRGTFGPTLIGEGTKIDNQVMIAHNCRIGRHNLICSQVGLAGSCTTGDYVVLAGQVGIKDHVNIGARTMLGAKSGVMQDVPADSQMVGAPATPIKEQMAIFATIQRLPEMRKQIRALERQVEVLRRAEAELVREAA